MPDNEKEIKVLVIDDEKNILQSIEMVLAYEHYKVITSANGLDGLELFKTEQPDIVLLDVRMPGLDGLTVLKGLKEINPFTEIIMISGHSGVEEAVTAAKYGAFDFLEKPISREKLLLTVRNAWEKGQLRRENITLKGITEKKYSLIGESLAMRDLLSAVDRVARTSTTVLITGESGTGKELIARRIHARSSRHNFPFVQVNCAAIPDELIESELFGHEKGSFTGAFERKTGKFESAHRGTIFLDEVGDLSLKAQAKVLRVLEEGEIQRVGTAEIRQVDVRIVAATNKNLKEAIQDGSFREDLFFRLNVFPIHSPALRQRRDDIPRLIDHFIVLFSSEHNFKKKQIAPQALDLLTQYDWPGNIRELRNLVERMLILSDGPRIEPSQLPPPFSNPDLIRQNQDFGHIRTWKDFKQMSEKAYLEYKIREYDYNLAKTAREIDLPRSNLYKKMESLGISQPGGQAAADGEGEH